ncbi:MAG: type IV secretory system conjugative DNA transfer family protein [Planctomycetes bacterium]|nr:type IV secretory system conjugative DNA transfer family protein [Planctomycetota bacterium]
MPAAPIARPQHQPFRPPAISILYSGFWSFASYQLYLLGQSGWEWGTLAAFVAGAMAIGQFIQAANDRFKVGGHRRKVKRFRAGKMKHGNSRFGTIKDIAAAKILSNKQGIFLGTIRRKRAHRDVFYDDEGSISIIAPPGESKTMSIVVPTLLANPGQNLIVNDPAGEVYSICNLALQKAGYEVCVLTPYPNEVSTLIGQKVTDMGVDVFSSLKPDMDPGRIRGQIENIMRWVMPGKVSMDEKSEFFYRSARMLGGFFALKELSEGRKPTLPAIRSHLMEGPAFIHDAFNDAEGSTAFGGVYEELAKSLGGVLTAAPQQFAGGFGIAEQCLDPYDHFSSMGQHTSGSIFDPSSLKQTTQLLPARSR